MRQPTLSVDDEQHGSASSNLIVIPHRLCARFYICTLGEADRRWRLHLMQRSARHTCDIQEWA